MNKPKDKKNGKKNVQVVVRLRPLNNTERNEGGISTIKADVVTKTIATSVGKQFGPFDKCYGPEATQQEVYMDTVAPLIKEVLNGFNCTVFAYGQTGTGKTFTMEGTHDEEGDYSWDSDPKAGIIPRALHQIFSALAGIEDFCVRVSYVELYNEELYDLLGPAGDAEQRLRIFDDKAHGNGILINNLTEVTVRNRNEVYSLLKKGAERRRTAATLMNMSSSRSHSVFTVSVLFRDNETKSEELLLKTGKLNLVDLAGSENIGRSGSTAGRAREAGSINQSLLTLGRVITALTSNASHIPYRESKLTRILQDSLGGKTITTIIATLTPSSTSLEESVSTLEYAQRAKNIKNSPEVNQQITRKALLREYSDEIERLRRDLIAAREKNGVFLAQENYDELQEQIKENNARIDELEAQLEVTMRKYEQVVKDFEFIDQQYQIAYQKHLAALSKLAMRMDELKVEKEERLKSLKQYEAAKLALEQSEDEGRKLYAQARQVNESNIVIGNELEKMHEKYMKCQMIFEENNKLLGNFSANQIGSTHRMKDEIYQFNSASIADIESMKGHCRAIHDASVQRLRKMEEVSKSVNVLVHDARGYLSDLLSEFKNNSENQSNGFQQGLLTKLTTLSGILSGLLSLENNHYNSMESFMNSCRQYFESHSSSIEAFNLSSVAKFEEEKLLYSQMEELVRRLKANQESRAREVEEFVENQTMSRNALVNVAGEKSMELKNTFEKASEGNANAQNEIEKMNSLIPAFVSGSIKITQEVVSDTTFNLTTLSNSVQNHYNEVNSNLNEATTVIGQQAEVLCNTMDQHREVDNVLATKAVNHLDASQKSMEHFVHQELVRFKSDGDTPARKRRAFGVELMQPSSANDLYSNAAANLSPIKAFSMRESILAPEMGMLMSPDTIKAALVAQSKKPTTSVSSEGSENMQVDG
ncbi:hypothetical protein FO519_008596 [Halicephalobus sp. NKZ332]|nr:hypothetical protein FO519_008596 [Halicephalobus sp. NKZ332]